MHTAWVLYCRLLSTSPPSLQLLFQPYLPSLPALPSAPVSGLPPIPPCPPFGPCFSPTSLPLYPPFGLCFSPTSPLLLPSLTPLPSALVSAQPPSLSIHPSAFVSALPPLSYSLPSLPSLRPLFQPYLLKTPDFLTSVFLYMILQRILQFRKRSSWPIHGREI